VTYISSCHAGCSNKIELENGTKSYTNCQCIDPRESDDIGILSMTTQSYASGSGGSASEGACPIDCMPKFYVFIVILCINKFIKGTEGTANFLLGMR